MDPIQTIDNPNLRPIIGNNPINIPSANINRISGPSVISTIDRPNVRGVEAPVVRGLEVPIVDVQILRLSIQLSMYQLKQSLMLQ